MNVTVIIAVFNQRPDWLLEAVNSVHGVPLVIADDGSTSNQTFRVMDHFALMEDGPRVVCYAHRGMEPTLNAAIALATTDYVAILDSDDLRYRAALEQQVAFLDLTPEAVACHGRFDYIDADGKVIRENVLHPTPCHSSLVFRKSAWERVAGYPEGFTFGEGDSYFIERLAGVGDVVAVPIVCAARRVHPNSLSFPNQPRLQRILREHQGTK